jgi:predicted nucleic acid-binding protein
MISLVNDFSPLLDTCTLAPISLCDLLLRLAEAPALYKPKWSEGILEELSRVLRSPKFGLDEAKVRYRIQCMKSAFPEAMITNYEFLVEAMPNNEKDRHVLAAAVHGKVDAIVTLNTRDFSVEHLQRFGIERLTPDDFLTHQWSLDESLVLNRIRAQADECGKDIRAHLNLISKMVPKFGSLVCSSLSR